MAAPKTIRQIRRFVGLVNYYRDLFFRRAHLLAPLTKLCSPKVKFKWTQIEQDAFEAVKNQLAADIMLAYPDFSKTFEIYTDASDYQLGGVIMQNGKPIAFFKKIKISTEKLYCS